MSRPKIKSVILAILARKKSYTFLLCALLQCSADSLSAHGNLHKEIEVLSLKIQATPKNVALWLERASLSRQHSDFDGALRDLTHARTLDSCAAEYDFLFGRVYARARFHKSAILHLNRFLLENPEDPEALLTRAKSLFITQDVAGACLDYDKAIGLLENPTPGQLLEQAHAHALNPDTGAKTAINRLEAAMARIGRIPTLQEAALQYEVQSENYAAALKRINELIHEAPRQERWLIQKGQVLLRADRQGEAQKCFQQVIQLIDALPAGVRERTLNQDLKRTAEAFLLEIDN